MVPMARPIAADASLLKRTGQASRPGKTDYERWLRINEFLLCKKCKNC